MTTSAVAVLDCGSPQIATAQYYAGRGLVDEERITASLVYFRTDGKVGVGEHVRSLAEADPERAVRCVKRHVGTDWTAIIDGKTFTPEQISAFILRKLKEDAEKYLGPGGRVGAAAIAVPASFKDAQRQAVREASRIAGMEAVWLIDEPIAAALGHRLGQRGQPMILVFHLGGVTLNVSLIKMGDGLNQVLASSSDDDLGGENWTQRVFTWLMQDIKSRYGIDASTDKMMVRRVREAAEKAKIELSQSAETRIRLPNFRHLPADGSFLNVDTRLTRKEFRRMTADLTDRCRGPVQQVIHDAGIHVGDINHVILVGGSTWMPAVSTLMKSLTKGEVSHSGARPEEAIALGACIYAATQTNQRVAETQQEQELAPIPHYHTILEENSREFWFRRDYARPPLHLAKAGPRHPSGDETTTPLQSEASTKNDAGMTDPAPESLGRPETRERPRLSHILSSLSPAGSGLTAVAVTTAGAYFVAAVSVGHPLPWWPYILFSGLALLGSAGYVIRQQESNREVSASPEVSDGPTTTELRGERRVQDGPMDPRHRD
jgi:hypothetical protein